jgi:acetylornithine deacetylase/succinyl-diaminopimelate desuccinylase-like protein
MLESALNFARVNKQLHLSRLCDWLHIPSISTLPEHVADVRRAAEFAAQALSSMGMTKAEVRETEGHPIVYAEWLDIGPTPAAPTLLIYGHFDVQPIDPAEEWTHPPFDPIVEGDNL